MPIALISHSDCLLHDVGSHHPEQPARLTAIQDQLIASGLMPYLTVHEAPEATAEQLGRVHAAGYITAIEHSAPVRGLVHLDPDTAMMPGSLNAARRAAGAAVAGTDMVIAGEASCAFCLVRPPGHHAGRDRAMGFCIFNNVAVGAAHALEAHGLARVAVIDFDVHHGNGTEDIFRNDVRVLMVSTFQHPFYPYSGTEGRSERMVNVPLAAGSSGREFRAAVIEHWLPALHAFRPDMLFVSAGFDAHREDDMAAMQLVEADYAWVSAELARVAARHCRGRIVSVLEGGYALSALGRSVVAHIKSMAGV